MAHYKVFCRILSVIMIAVFLLVPMMEAQASFKQQDIPCGVWVLSETGNNKDNRIIANLNSSGSGKNCLASVSLKNNTDFKVGLFKFGSYTFQLSTRSNNATLEWLTPFGTEDKYLTSLDMDLQFSPNDPSTEAYVDISGDWTLKSYSFDAAVLLLKTGLDLAGVDTGCVPAEALILATVRGANIIDNAFVLTNRGDLLGAKNELGQALPMFFDRAAEVFQELTIGGSCAAKLANIKAFLTKPVTIARIIVNYFTWSGKVAFDYLKYEGASSVVRVTYTPPFLPEPTPTIVPVMGWIQINSPTTKNLSSIKMISSNNGFAVGDNGVILHWDGNTWKQIQSPTSNNLIDIAIVPDSNGTDAWIVGNNTTILHWDGSNWYEFDNRWNEFMSGYGYQDPRWLNSVWMVSATDGWVSDSNWGRLLHWDGSQWGDPDGSRIAYSSGSASSVVMYSSSDGWFVGNYIGHWNGTEWEEIYNPNSSNSNIYYTDIGMTPGTSNTDGWIIGDGGTLLRWDGSAWSNFPSVTSSGLYDVVILSSTSGWIVGSNGTILKWNGNNWSLVGSSTSKDLYSMAMVSETDGWAVGADGTILHYQEMP